MANKLKKNEKRMVWRKIEEETVVMDMESGYIHSLDDVGTVIWGLFDDYQKVEEVLKELKRTYPGVKEKTLKKDLNNFIKELQKKELLISVEKESETV